MKIECDYSLLEHNTFGIDAKCRRFVEYESVEEAQEAVRSLKEEDHPLLILGGGSNLLLTEDYKGTVLHSGISFIEDVGGGRVRCGSGYVWDDFVAYCVSHGLYGAENLSIIPGECGASAVQAGCVTSRIRTAGTATVRAASSMSGATSTSLRR